MAAVRSDMDRFIDASFEAILWEYEHNSSTINGGFGESTQAVLRVTQSALHTVGSWEIQLRAIAGEMGLPCN